MTDDNTSVVPFFLWRSESFIDFISKHQRLISCVKCGQDEQCYDYNLCVSLHT